MRALGRRQAALLALIVAGSASIATSPTPQPVVTKSIEYAERLELTAAKPVAVRRLSVLLDAKDPPSDLNAVLAGRIEVPGLKNEEIRFTVVPDQPGSPHVVEMAKGAASQPETTFFRYTPGYPDTSSCVGLPCARTYRVVVELVDDKPADVVKVSFRVDGGVTVRGSEKVPDGISFSVDPVDELLLIDRAPGVQAVSTAQEPEIGGPDRKGSELHAIVTFKGDALPARPVWPVVSELVLHVDAANAGARKLAACCLALTVTHSGDSATRPQAVYFAADQLPISVSLQPVTGCPRAAPCSIAVDATLGALSPGDLVPLRWWVEARVRYLDGAKFPTGAAVEVTSVTAAERTAAILKLCDDNQTLVLGEAHRRGLLTDAEFLTQLDEVQAGTWDPAPLKKLEQYEAMCLAAMATLNGIEAPPSLPPSESDPFAPRVEATLGTETVVLSAETPLFVRDVRLTRNAAAADPGGAVAVSYLRIITSATKADPRAYINAFVQVLPIDGSEPLVKRYDIPASDLAGPPLEVDPWAGCEAQAPCTVDLRIVLAWWDWEPRAGGHEVTWQLKAGRVWPGLPEMPDGAEVKVQRVASLDASAASAGLTGRAAGTDIVLTADGEKMTRHVTLRLNGEAWPAELNDVPMPGRGLFTVSATGTGTGPAPMVGTLIQPADQEADRGLGGAATVNAGGVTQAFFPFNSCKGRAPCVTEYTFEFTRVDKGGDYGPVAVAWSLEAMLRAFESIQLPIGAALAIHIDD